MAPSKTTASEPFDDEISELTNDPALEGGSSAFKAPVRVGGRVAERHYWLQEEAFRRTESKQSTASKPEVSGKISSVVEKFGGARRSAVCQRKQEWETKWAANRKAGDVSATSGNSNVT
jgi:hypothetical protein